MSENWKLHGEEEEEEEVWGGRLMVSDQVGQRGVVDGESVCVCTGARH